MDQESIYIGNRYVPKLEGEWNQLKEYEGLSIVTLNGSSYTSKKRIPQGVAITNEEYWVKTGDSNGELIEFKEEVTAQLAQIDGFVSITKFKHALNSYTKAFNDACAFLLEKGGGEIRFPVGNFPVNLKIPTGIVVSGNGTGKINDSVKGGTVFYPEDGSKPAVSIAEDKMIQGSRMRDVVLDGRLNSDSTDGLYVSGAHYIILDRVNVLNFNRYNIHIENRLNLNTFFITMNSVTSYNAGVSNFKLEWHQDLNSFTTAIYGNDFISYTLPGKVVEGRIAYIGAEFNVNGWMEDSGNDLIVIDKDIHPSSGLIGRGLLVDGLTGNKAVKLKSSDSSLKINQFIRGDVSIDGYVTTPDGGKSVKNQLFDFSYEPNIFNPKIYNYLMFNDQEKSNDDGFNKTRIYSSYGVLRIDSTRPDSKGIEFSTTYDKPFIIGNSPAGKGMRIWYDSIGNLRTKTSTSLSDNDGLVIPVYRSAPSSPTSSGSKGQISGNADYIYYCYDDNKWIRTPKDDSWV